MCNKFVIFFFTVLFINCNLKNDIKKTWEESFTYIEPSISKKLDKLSICEKKGPIYCKELVWDIANPGSFENLRGEYTFHSNRSFNEPFYDLRIDSKGRLFYESIGQVGNIMHDSSGAINVNLLCENSLIGNKIKLTNVQVKKISCEMLGESDAQRGIVFKMQITIDDEAGCYFEKYMDDNTFCEFYYELKIK